MIAFTEQSTQRITIRTVSPSAAAAPEARTCSARSCTQKTRSFKPFCGEHLAQHPYVEQLLAQLAAADQEVLAVAKHGHRAVAPGGLVASEILGELRIQGALTAARLSRDLSLAPAVLQAYLRALASRGLITLGRGSRKQVVVSLVVTRPGRRFA